MDKILYDKRKEVHARLDFGENPRKSRRVRGGSQNSSAGTLPTRYRDPSERSKILDHLKYNDEDVYDRLGHRRQSAFDRLSNTYSPSTTKSGSNERNSKDRSHSIGRSRRRGGTLGNAYMVPHVQLYLNRGREGWFDELPPESIDGYKGLKAAFLAYFMQQKNNTYSPSTTKSGSNERNSKDRSHSIGRSRRRGFSSRDRPRDKNSPRGIEQSYSNTRSSYKVGDMHGYHACDKDRSCSMKRGRENKSPLSRVSKSGTIDGEHWKTRAKRRKPADEEDLSVAWTCEDVDPFTPRIRNFKSSRKTRMPNNVKTYDETRDPKDHLKIFQAMAQRDEETIEEFMKRFKIETGRMKGAPECMRISRFVHGVNNPELTKRLNEHVPTTVEEMMTAITAFIRGEIVAASKKTPHSLEVTGPVLVEVLKENSIQEREMATVVEEEEATWMTPIIEYLRDETLLDNRKEASKLRIKSRQYELLEGILYRRSFLKPRLRHPQQPLTPITPWPFYKWGIDIACTFPEGPGKVKFLIVAMDYFTKWIEAKAVATISGSQVKKFVWDNIVCRFGLSEEIVTDNVK
nr:reverse transcriptase domain-containing protein [Tanacetum cinerariifolium]